MFDRFLLCLSLLCCSATSAAGLQSATQPTPTSPTAKESGELLLVLNKSANSLWAINPDTGESSFQLPTGDGPHEVDVSPNGRLAVVTDYGKNTPGKSLHVFDLKAQKRVSVIDLGSNTRPHGLDFLNDTQVAITTEGSGYVHLVNLETGLVEKSVKTGAQLSHMAVLAPASDSTTQRLLYVANTGSGSISVVDLQAGKLITKIETGAGAEAIDVSPNGHEVWVGNRDANTVTVITTKDNTVTHQLPCERFPIRAKFTPDGNRVLVSAAMSGELVLFDAHEKKELKRIRMNIESVVTEKAADDRVFGGVRGPMPVGILVQPDGQRAFVANTNADRVTIIDLNTFKATRFLKTDKEPDGMAWWSAPQ